MDDQSTWAKQERTFHRLTSDFFFNVAKLYITGLWFIEQSGENHSSHPPAINRRFSRAWYNFCTLTYFQSLPGLLISVYDSDPHGTVSDHRCDTISASAHKGQLTPTSSKGLASIPGTHHCILGSLGTLTVSSACF